MRALVPALLVALGIGLWFAACSQGEGDRCQINSDCASGLVCNQATQSCSKTIGGGIDATVPTIDASIDAPDDAMVDAPDAM